MFQGLGMYDSEDAANKHKSPLTASRNILLLKKIKKVPYGTVIWQF
jgi:hypothetical protein